MTVNFSDELNKLFKNFIILIQKSFLLQITIYSIEDFYYFHSNDSCLNLNDIFRYLKKYLKIIIFN